MNDRNPYDDQATGLATLDRDDIEQELTDFREQHDDWDAAYDRGEFVVYREGREHTRFEWLDELQDFSRALAEATA